MVSRLRGVADCMTATSPKVGGGVCLHNLVFMGGDMEVGRGLANYAVMSSMYSKITKENHQHGRLNLMH